MAKYVKTFGNDLPNGRKRPTETKSPDVYWKNKVKSNIRDLKYGIERLWDLGIKVDLNALCKELDPKAERK